MPNSEEIKPVVPATTELQLSESKVSESVENSFKKKKSAAILLRVLLDLLLPNQNCSSAKKLS